MLPIKSDLEEIFRDFRWTVKGFENESGVHHIPKIPQVISGFFESLAKEKTIPFVIGKYNCEVIEGGSREYPDLILQGGKLGEGKIAIEFKTARRKRPNESSRMSLGSCAGYFLYPSEKRRGCRFPYGEFSEHWVVGFIYTWNPEADSSQMVSDIEIIVHPKWRIASRSTATGDTAAIGSVTNIANLKAGEGEFKSEDEFEEYWRERGRRYKR